MARANEDDEVQSAMNVSNSWSLPNEFSVPGICNNLIIKKAPFHDKILHDRLASAAVGINIIMQNSLSVWPTGLVNPPGLRISPTT
jgi:hypothetical protein